jgi:hypothetical protein
MARNRNNHCGIASYAQYPIVATTTPSPASSTRNTTKTTINATIATTVTATSTKVLTSTLGSTTRAVSNVATTRVTALSSVTIRSTTRPRTRVTTVIQTTTPFSADWYSSACYFNSNTIFTFGLKLATPQCVTVCLNSKTCTHYTVDTFNNFCWLHFGNVTPRDALYTTNFNYGCGIVGSNSKNKNKNNNNNNLGSAWIFAS